MLFGRLKIDLKEIVQKAMFTTDSEQSESFHNAPNKLNQLWL